MKAKIKTRETKQNIKVHDSAANVADRVKKIGVKSKEAASENINQTDNVSPEQYASDKISDAIKSGTETAAVGTKKAVKKGAERAKTKIKEKVAERKDKSEVESQVDETQTVDGTNSSTGNESSNNNGKKPKSEKKTEAKQSPKTKSADKKAEQSDAKGIKEKENKPAVKEKTQASPKQREVETPVEGVKKPRQRKQTPPKTKGKPSVKKVNAEKQTIKTPGSDVNKIKQTKRSLYNQNKAIKKANNKVKTAQRTAKTAKSTAKTSAEIAKRTKQTAQATAKATVKAVKVAAKAVVELGKATVEAVKGIGAIIAAGGVPAVVVIIVICLIGAIGGTCFGIFLSNDETTGTQKTMSQAISELTSEHYANLTAMKASYTYDLLEVNGNTSINWKDVLAVYAVRTTSSENPLEVVTLDDNKMDILRKIMEDMNTMTGVVTPKVVAETVVTTNENGEQVKTTQYVTKKVLTVTIIQLSKDEISELYNFNDEQKAQLDELMSEEYDDLWAELVGASGQIIEGNSSYVGTGMFAWPFENDQYISSRFGTRVDPISGEVKTHGGTDIAAPLGTPILAAADGVVVTATWHNSYGYYVKIKHDDTYSTLYAHCSVLHVSVGQTVKQGQVIADCGSTGYSTGPHCHFEVIQNGVRVDALRFYNVS